MFTGDGIVLRNDFVDLWMAKYGDNHSDTNHFFDNLDPNRDHQIDVHDVVDQLPELGRTHLITFTNYLYLTDLACRLLAIKFLSVV